MPYTESHFLTIDGKRREIADGDKITATSAVYSIETTWQVSQIIEMNGVNEPKDNGVTVVGIDNKYVYTRPLLSGKHRLRAVKAYSSYIAEIAFEVVEVEKPTLAKVASKPRTAPGGATMVENITTSGKTIENMELTAADGFAQAGHGWQVSADNVTIRNVKSSKFSDYFLYARPGIKNCLVEDVTIIGGTDYEAIIRNAGGQVTLSRVVVRQERTGQPPKNARTLLRGPGEWSIEDCAFAGGSFGPNPMARLNAGQDIGLGEFHHGRGSGNMITSEGGQMLRPPTQADMLAAVRAVIDARAANKSRQECIRAGLIAGNVPIPSGATIGSVVADTSWNRERMLGQRSKVIVRNCRFEVSDDGVPVTIEIQPGTAIEFIDCWFHPKTVVRVEQDYPDHYVYPERHPTNTEWTLPGDIVRPWPIIAGLPN